MAIKICYIDTETTGTDHYKNGIIQLSAIMEIDGAVVDQFDIRVKPFEGAEISEEALQVTGVTREEIAGYTPDAEAYRTFIAWLGKHISKFEKTDKAFFSGYNAKFDEEFIRQLFTRCGDVYFGSWFWSGTLDVMGFSLYSLMFERASLPNFKLGTVAEHVLGKACMESILEQAGGGLHNSLADILVTRALFKAVTEGVNS